jgi:Flp pilus assembly protein TadB
VGFVEASEWRGDLVLMSQILGVVLIALAGWLLWSPWALVIAGAVLLIAPEVGLMVRRERDLVRQDRQLRRRGGA